MKCRVKLRGRAGIIYEEGDMTLLVDSELQFDPAGVAVYRNSILHWEPPFDKEVISSEEAV